MPKAVSPVGNVEVSVEAVSNRDIGRNHEHAATGETEGKECYQAGLPAPDWQLEDCRFPGTGEVFESCSVGLALGVPELVVLVDLVLDGCEEILDRPACPHPGIEVFAMELPGLPDPTAGNLACLG